MGDQPGSLGLHRRRLGVPRPPHPPPPGDEDPPPPEDEDPLPPEDEDLLDLLRKEEEAERDAAAREESEAEGLAFFPGEGEVDFDDGLLPDPEEEEVEYLSDDRVFQALNEDLDVSMQS